MLPLTEYVQYVDFKRLLDEVSRQLDTVSARRFAVVSWQAGEGKTFLTSALAAGFARHLRKRVLVIDASDRASGLSLEDALNASPLSAETAFANVALLRFPKDADGQATEYDIASFIERRAQGYDVVIVDTGALQATSRRGFDPLVLARRVGAAVLVTDPSRRGTDWSAEALSFLSKEPIQWLGMIENGGANEAH